MYTPLHDKIIVQRLEKVNQTASGIILKSSPEPDRAKVVSIGPDVEEVAVGEEILVNWNGAIKVKDDLYTLKVEHVVGVFEDNASVV